MSIQKFVKWQVLKGFRPIQKFYSESGLLTLVFPRGWLHKKPGSVYEFVLPGRPDLILQISIAANSAESNEVFNSEEELAEIRQERKFAEISKIGTYEAVHYCLQHSDSSLIEYRWHSGDKKVKTFITLLHHDVHEKDQLDSIYSAIIAVLQTMEVIQPKYIVP